MYQKAALCRMIANKMELKSLIFENPSDVDNIGTKINHFYLTWTGNPIYNNIPINFDVLRSCLLI